MTKTKRVKACGVLVFAEQPERRFLLMRHADRWDLPKGRVDGDETDLECALRELHEETGIEAPDVCIDPEFRFVHEYSFLGKKDGQRRDKTLVVFLGELLRDVTIQVTEHPAFQWHAWEPPHRIQLQTVDPLLLAVEQFWQGAR